MERWGGDRVSAEGTADLGIGNGELFVKKRRRKKAPLAPVAYRGEIMQEALPLPFVHYPPSCGTFLGFSETENGVLCFCSCAEDPLRNLLRLLALQKPSRNANPPRTSPLRPYVPDRIAQAALSHRDNPLQDVTFRPGLCHRCNCTAPALRWCHEMYGGPFEQHYGWYIKQTYLRFGIDAMRMVFLDDICPIEYQATIKEVKQVRDALQEERTRLYVLEHSPPRVDIHREEKLYRHNVRMSEAKTMIALKKQYTSLRTALLGSIDSITRQEFGMDKWVSETVLYQIVCRIVHPDCVLRHFRPEWLGGLELDIYIPDRRFAIEYQGQQHFHPIEVWGGDEGLEALQARDAKKAKACKQHGVCLITFDYKESLTEDYVRKVLVESLEDRTQNGH